MLRACGWRPDPPKALGASPDLDAGDLLGSDPPPAEAGDETSVLSVLDQGAASTCVLHAIPQQIRTLQRRLNPGVLPPLGSRLFGYYAARATHHEQHIDGGTYLRAAFEAISKLGLPPEFAWPYDLSKVNTAPPPRAYGPAFDASVKRQPQIVYRRIRETGAARIDAIKRAIAAGYTVSFGTEVGPTFEASDGKTPLDPPRDEATSGHALLCVAYVGDLFRIVNSWGRNWADGGWVTLKAEYLADDVTRDLWIVVQPPKVWS